MTSQRGWDRLARYPDHGSSWVFEIGMKSQAPVSVLLDVWTWEIYPWKWVTRSSLYWAG